MIEPPGKPAFYFLSETTKGHLWLWLATKTLGPLITVCLMGKTMHVLPASLQFLSLSKVPENQEHVRNSKRLPELRGGSGTGRANESQPPPPPIKK